MKLSLKIFKLKNFLIRNKVEKRAFFQGILLTIFIFGPLLAFGFILPAVSMMYVDFYRANGISMDRHDPEWVGAWWLGKSQILFFLGLKLG